MRMVFLLLMVISGCIDAAPGLTTSEHQRLSKVEQRIETGEFSNALQTLTLMEKNSVSATAFVISRQMLARLYADKGQYQQALAALLAANKLQRLSSKQRDELLLARAKLRYALAQWAKSAALFEVLGWSKLTLSDQLMLGHSLLKLGRYPQAAKALSGLEKAQPPATEVQLQWLLLARQKALQSSQVERLLRKMLVAFPLRERYWLQLTQHYQRRDDVSKATTVLHSAYLQGVLKSEVAIRKLVGLLLQRGAPIQASEVIRSAITEKLLNDPRQDWQLLAKTQIIAKDYVAAQHTLEQALRLSDNVINRKMLVSVLLYRQHWQAAHEQLLLLAKDPMQASSIELQLQLISASYHLDKIQQANKYLFQALSLAPQNSTLKQWQSVLKPRRNDCNSTSVECTK